LGKSIGFTPHKAWLFPMVASLKSAMSIQESTVTWKIPPSELVDAVAVTLFNRVKKSFEDAQKNMNAVGRNAELYEVLTLLAEKAVLRLVAEGKSYKKTAAA
jgi:hypothetical protein